MVETVREREEVDKKVNRGRKEIIDCEQNVLKSSTISRCFREQPYSS